MEQAGRKLQNNDAWVNARVSTVSGFRATCYGDDGRQTSEKYFIHEDIARASVKGKGGWGGYGGVNPVTFTIVEYFDPIRQRTVVCQVGNPLNLEFEDSDEVRTRALSKLTDEEKTALGLQCKS